MSARKGQRAVIYARFSTDLQSDRSIDDQVALCRDFAAKEGLTLGKAYSDRAKTSASLIGRDGLMNLMADARDGQFDVVIVEALDRLSRDQEDLAGIYKRLSFAGIDIQAVHDGLADAVQIGIRGLLGTLFLTDLKHKVRRGMQGVVRDGRNAGGRAYGYRPVPGHPGELSIEPDEAAIVQRIFKAYIAGETPRSIAGTLNAERIAPPRGSRWNASTLNGNAERGYGILVNPLYNGEIIWNRVRMVRDPDTGKRVSRVNPMEEWQRAEAEHLRIVSRELFVAAQNRRAQRSKAHTQGQSTRIPKRPFSGLIRCGVCGGGMSIHDRKGSAVRIRCSTARESGTCRNDGRFRLDKIEAEIFAQLRQQLSNPVYLKEYIRTYREERRQSIDRATRDRTKLERAVTKANAHFERLLNLYGQAVIDGPKAERQISEAQAELRAAEAALAEADIEVPVIELHPQATERFAQAIDTLAERYTGSDPAFDQEAIHALRALVAEITVKPAKTHGALVEVTGYLSALIGENIHEVGGAMVAEEATDIVSQ